MVILCLLVFKNDSIAMMSDYVDFNDDDDDDASCIDSCKSCM